MESVEKYRDISRGMKNKIHIAATKVGGIFSGTLLIHNGLVY